MEYRDIYLPSALFLSTLESYAPDIYHAAKAAYDRRRMDGVCLHPETKAYMNAPSRAVDYAVMEHMHGARLVELRTGWHDIGCWPALLNVQYRQIKDKIYSPRAT